jgi:predicted dehydrogenase
VVEKDARRRKIAQEMYSGCVALKDYKELFNKNDIDLVVNVSYSNEHYAITKDLLEHKKNVLVDKPFARNQFECDTLMNTAKKNKVVLAVFQNSQPAPYYQFAQKLIQDGTLGKIEQISIRFNGFARRWDWQTMQRKMGGSVYNTGPHPIGMGLGFLGFDKDTKVVYSKLAKTTLSSGDGEDYAKIILTAPNKPIVDIEISALDCFSDYTLKIQGSKGTYKASPFACKYKYIVDGENTKQKLIEKSLQDEQGNPLYCSEKLNIHTEEVKFDGTHIDSGTVGIYQDIYYALTENKPLRVTNEQATMVMDIIDKVHALNA